MAANLECFAGDTLPIVLRLKDSEGAVFDLTGYAAAITVKDDNGEIEEIELDPSVDLEDGELTTELTPAQTETLKERKRTRVVLALTDPDGAVTHYAIGKIRVRIP